MNVVSSRIRCSWCFVIAFAAALFVPLFGFAQVTPKIVNPVGKVSDFPQFLDMLLTIFQLIMTPILVVALVWSGFLFVTARGDESQIASAKRIFLWTLVGAAIIIGARVIYNIAEGTVQPFITAV
jgi:hypothetical protein